MRIRSFALMIACLVLLLFTSILLIVPVVETVAAGPQSTDVPCLDQPGPTAVGKIAPTLQVIARTPGSGPTPNASGGVTDRKPTATPCIRKPTKQPPAPMTPARPTPTSLASPTLPPGVIRPLIANDTYIGKDYARIAANDWDGFQQAISAVNNNDPNTYGPYVIFLDVPPGGTSHITLLGTQVIFKHVEIYGRGLDNTFIEQAPPNISPDMAGIMTVNTGAQVKLHNVTIQNGYSFLPQYNAVNGAGVLIWVGHLYAYNSRFHNNRASNAGGAIHLLIDGAQLDLENVILSNNSADLAGGALSDWSTQGNPTWQAHCVRFMNNGPSILGGAIYSSGAQGAIVQQSSFVGNTGNDIWNTTTNIPINASSNWWGGSTPAVTDGVTVQPILGSDPTSSFVGGGPSPCNINPPTTPDVPTAELLRYGVQLSGNWTLDQKIAIRDAVVSTAKRFVAFRNSQVPHDAYFRQIMGVTLGQTNTYITVAKNGSGGVCDTPTRTISCDPNMTITQYTIAHELGHIFDYRSGIGSNMKLSDYVNQTADSQTNVNFIFDNASNTVMGNIQQTSGLYVWRRGERGWGSGPGSDYQNNDDINGNPTVRHITNFQQHAAPYANQGDANLETAADMFLNWVYDAFQNASWRPGYFDPVSGTRCSLLVNGCDDTLAGSGDARRGWLNQRMASIFNNRGW